MSDIESQSGMAGHRIRSFFIPSGLTSVLYILLGSILLVLFSFSNLLNLIGANYLGPAYKLSLNINILNNTISKSLGSAFGGRLGQIVVWSLVGAVTYLCLWFLKNLLNSFENDIIIDHYRHPENFSRAGYWGSAVSAKIFFGALVIILATYSYLVLKVVMPAAANLASSAVYNFRLPASLVYIVLCVLIPAAAIYVWMLIARLLSHLWKLL